MTERQAKNEIDVSLPAIARLIERVRFLKAKFPQLKCGVHKGNPGSILNAYREGDLTFDEAVAELQEIRTETIRSLASAGF